MGYETFIMTHPPLNAADSVSVLLVGVGLVFLYVGLENSHSGYITIAVIEFALAVVQSVVNRMDIMIE